MDYAFQYAMEHSIVLESEYKYLGQQKLCQYQNIAGKGIKISGYVDVLPYNYQALVEAVSKQPVSVAVDASSWMFYESGIIDQNCGNNLNHANLAVGYVINGNNNYWILKNSWGTTWGENGYLKIGIKGAKGLCGINMAASYPTIK